MDTGLAADALQVPGEGKVVQRRLQGEPHEEGGLSAHKEASGMARPKAADEMTAPSLRSKVMPGVHGDQRRFEEELAKMLYKHGDGSIAFVELLDEMAGFWRNRTIHSEAKMEATTNGTAANPRGGPTICESFGSEREAESSGPRGTSDHDEFESVSGD